MTDSPGTEGYDQFVTLFMCHERAVRCVIRSMLPSLQDADEVMQEVALTCWHKFSNFQTDDSQDAFFRWACVIARFEVLKYRRKCARDRLVLSDETIQLLSAEAEDRALIAEQERQAMEACLNRMPPADRRLILSVHTRGDSVADIARQLGQKTRRLYSRVNALRDLLGECVRQKLADGGT